MSDAFMGEIRIVSFAFAPQFWAKCDGQLMSISQNSALFSLLGIQFGGDGVSNFALPDMRGRVPISGTSFGEKGGLENTVLLPNNLPPHNHQVFVSNQNSTSSSPTGNFIGLAEQKGGDRFNFSSTSNTGMNASTVSSSGNNGHNNIQPCAVVNFCIALQGVYPSRN